jgi:hypothetical protein
MPDDHSEAEARMPFPVLIADIGGTNARFAIVVDSNAEPKRFPPIKTAEYETLDVAIQQTVLDKTSVVPKSAVLAVAGPTDGDEIDLTNCHWIVRPKTLIADLGFSDVLVMNDYEAQALAVVALDAQYLKPIGNGERVEYSNRVVIGPGTGLGVAGIVHGSNSWIPVAGEGGHVDLGPRTARDYEIFPHLETIGGRIFRRADPVRARPRQSLQRHRQRRRPPETPFETGGNHLRLLRRQRHGRRRDCAAVHRVSRARRRRHGARLHGPRRHLSDRRHNPESVAGPQRGPFSRRLRQQGTAPQPARADASLCNHARPGAAGGLSAFARMPGRFGVDTSGRWWRDN